MKPVSIIIMRHLLWSRNYSVHPFSGHILSDDESLDDILPPLITLPRFSHAHVRQLFIKKKGVPKAVLAEYGLTGYPDFPLQEDVRTYPQDGERIGNAHTLISWSDPRTTEYIGKVHIYNEDHQIEGEFWEFFDAYTLPIAREWCDTHGISYIDE
jgi:hypothetical protein